MMTVARIGGDLTVYGPGSLRYLSTIKGKRAVIFTTSSAVKNGVYDRAAGYLKEAGIESDGFFEKELHPSFELVKRGADFLIARQPDVVVAIGGGSILDAAKIMVGLYENPEIATIDELISRLDTLSLKKKERTYFVPTTAGSASEASKSGIITDTKTKRKIPIRNFDLMPDVAILDPEVTLTLPAHLTAETGMDAITHLVEGYVSRIATPLSDIFSKPCAIAAIKTLPKVCNDLSNVELRGEMLVYAMAGGYSFSCASLGLCHGIAHGTGANLKIPHGVMNAITLPYVIRFNSRDERAASRYRELASEFGQTDFAKVIDDLNASLNIPKRYKDVADIDGYFNDNLTYLAECALKDSCSLANPIQATVEEVEALLKAAYYGE